MSAHGLLGEPQVLVRLGYRIRMAKWQEMMVTGSWRPFPLLCGQVFGEGNGESVMGLKRGVTREAERWVWRLSPSLKGNDGGYITLSRKWVLPTDRSTGLRFKFKVACGLYLMPSWSWNICAPLGSCKNRPRGPGQKHLSCPRISDTAQACGWLSGSCWEGSRSLGPETWSCCRRLPLAQAAPWRTLRNT